MVDFNVRVVITSNTAGARVVRGELNSLNTAGDRLKRTLTGAFGVLGAGVAIRSTVGTLANFSQEMSTVAAISEATGEEFAKLQEEAIQLGTNTRFSATQAAEGMTFLARAGFSAAESLETIDDTLRLAQAGALDLGRAADIASNVLQGFRLETDQAARVVDVLADAANSANTNVGQLGDALKFVAPVAAGLGVEVEETTAAISALSNAGLQASLAGTGLRRVLATLEQGTPQLEAALAGTGVTLEDVRVSTEGFLPALKALERAGIDTGVALEVFGQRGGPAFEVLRSSIGDIEEFTTNLKGAQGTAEQIAEVMDDNLNGAILATRSALQGLVLRLGEVGAQDFLVGFFNTLTVSLRFLADNAAVVGVVLSSLALSTLPALTTAVSALIVKSTILKATIAGGIFSPFVLGATAASVSIALVVDELVDLEKQSLKTTEAGEKFALTDFGKVGADITKVADRLERLNKLASKDLAAFGEVNEGLAKMIAKTEQRLKDLTEQQDRLRDGSAKTAAEARDQTTAMQTLAGAVGLSIVEIEKENQLLRLNAQERTIQARLLEEVARLEEASDVGVSAEDQDRLRFAIEANEELARRASLLEDLRGPQMEFEADLASLTALQKEGTISADEFDTAVAALTERFKGVDLSGLNIEGIDVGALAEANALRTEELRLEQEKAAVLSEVQGPLQGLIDRQSILRDLQLEGAITADEYTRAYSATATAIRELNPEQALLNQLVEEIQGPQREQAERQAALNKLYEDGTITLQQYKQALAGAKEATEVFDDTLKGGLTRGLEKGLKGITDVSGAAETVLVNAFGSAEDALVDFATTGEVNFAAFTEGILKDIARLLARQAVLGLINAFTGGSGIAIGSSLIGGPRAEGGPVNPNQAFLVGEQGPELFVPPGAGNIMTAAQTANAGSQQTRDVVVQAPPVTVVNVTDPEEVVSAINSPEGEQMILNVISRNRSNVNASLA